MFLKRALSMIAVGAAVAFGPGQAFAAAAPVPFCIDDSAANGGALSTSSNCSNGSGTNGFAVDLLNGGYVEKALVTDTGSGLAFNATIVVDFGQYQLGGSEVDAGLGGVYDLYAVVTASGVLTGANTFKANTATLSFYLDTGDNTTLDLTSIDSGTLAFTPGLGDLLLGTSTTLLSGSGSTASSGGSDGFAVTFTDFGLTSDGEDFFIAPRPFYLSVYSDGDINDGTVDVVGPGLLELRGDVSANFFIPEPGTLALVGLSMLGLGIARRRKA